MTLDLPLDRKRTAYDELFMQYLADIMLELKEIKVKTMRKDVEGIAKHTAEIKSTILALMDAEFERTVTCTELNN